jgi:cysteine desulfurase
VGALFVRRKPKIPLVPLIDGGGHERGLRSGTLNVPGIVGFGEACALAIAHGAEDDARLGAARDRLLARLRDELGHVEVNGAMQPRLAHNLNVSFWPIEAESLLLALRDDVAMSSGSACTSATLEPSYVLKAIRVPHDRAHCSIRIGLGRFNSDEQVERATTRIIEEVRAQRERNTTWSAARRREEQRGEQEAKGTP